MGILALCLLLPSIAMQRRHFHAAAGLGLLGQLWPSAHAATATAAAPAAPDTTFQHHCQTLEQQAQGRLGVHIIDSASGRSWGYRADERFMLLSSFKLLASALVLHRAETGQEQLTRRIAYPRSALVPWSPITELHADGPGLTLAQLCHATITTSDNTAGNLILDSFGGPAGLTAYVRQLGDTITRLDRTEPTLNEPTPEGLMDTTTPRAMAQTMQRLLLGDALAPNARQQLRDWLLANTTGGKRLKAGVPTTWQVGDKTGTSTTDANDVGLLMPPQRAPFIVTAYLAESKAVGPVKDACLAQVAQWVAKHLV